MIFIPDVTIKGISQKTNVDLKDLKDDVRLTISSVVPLGLKPDQVSVFIPFDLCVDVDEVIVTILIFQKEGRTDEVFKEMSDKLVALLRGRYFPDILVEVNVVLANPKHCSTSAA